MAEASQIPDRLVPYTLAQLADVDNHARLLMSSGVLEQDEFLVVRGVVDRLGQAVAHKRAGPHKPGVTHGNRTSV